MEPPAERLGNAPLGGRKGHQKLNETSDGPRGEEEEGKRACPELSNVTACAHLLTRKVKRNSKANGSLRTGVSEEDAEFGGPLEPAKQLDGDGGSQDFGARLKVLIAAEGGKKKTIS